MLLVVFKSSSLCTSLCRFEKIFRTFSGNVVSATCRLVWGLQEGNGLGCVFGESSVPKYILEAYHGEVSLMGIGRIATSAMAQSASPRLANYCLNDLTSFRHLMKKLLLIGLAIGIIFVNLFDLIIAHG